jgi:hypothetical protein
MFALLVLALKKDANLLPSMSRPVVVEIVASMLAFAPAASSSRSK